LSEYRIEKIDKDFDGLVFNQQNQAIKVPFTLKNELVAINKIDTTNNIGVAEKFSILEYSQNRVAPICPYFSKCGGCKAQHFSKEDYLKQKMANLLHLLEVNQISYPKDIEIIHHHGDKKGYRRRVILSVMGKKLGFKAYRSTNVVDIDFCPIATSNINKTLAVFKKIVANYNHKMQVSEITLSDIDGNIDVLIKAKSKINKEVLEAMPEAFAFPPIKKITWNNEILIVKEEVSLNYGKYQIPFSSGGFLQPEKFGEEVLINFAVNNLKNSTKVLDLFCGFGSYAFSLLDKGNIEKISLFDSSATAINALKKYSSSQVHVDIRDLFKNPLLADFINNFNGIIINPPRSGAFAQVKEIAKSHVENLVMIYCSATSIIRDCIVLKEREDLEIKQIKVLDQFIYSPHIEILIYFAKK
jgi:23S rRNA (uracil1939-C5)-methyltransferase